VGHGVAIKKMKRLMNLIRAKKKKDHRFDVERMYCSACGEFDDQDHMAYCVGCKRWECFECKARCSDPLADCLPNDGKEST